MNFEEFIRPTEPPQPEAEETTAGEITDDEAIAEEAIAEGAVPEELDVQKAVVESLAADKAAQDEEISRLKADNALLRSRLEENLKLIADLETQKAQTDFLKSQIAEMKAALEKVGDVLARNSEGEMSSKIALLERNVECDDHFPGETYDHVLEVLREARDKAESDGRIRRAQLLESVLVVNEPNGTLAKKRAELEKLFNDNANVISGTVIEELKKLGISHKKGEEYLLASEIINRTY